MDTGQPYEKHIKPWWEPRVNKQKAKSNIPRKERKAIKSLRTKIHKK